MLRSTRTFGALATIGILAVIVGLEGARQAPADGPPPGHEGHGQGKKPPGLDRALRAKLSNAAVTPLDGGLLASPEKIELGQMLFFDKELGGNRDMACATCHHPFFATGDGLSLSIGTGGFGLGSGRTRGAGRPFIPRNAPEIFNRGAPHWTSQFWDSRVVEASDGTFITPAGDLLPAGLDSVLAAQAMFPVTSAAEMRGEPSDLLDVFGAPNELSQIPAADLHAIWQALMDRLLAIEAYEDLFADAYPGTPIEDLGFQHAANAIAAFEAAAFTFLDCPFDQYVGGDDSALTSAQKRGASLFFGKANCSSCHSGPLLTDQRHHNLAVPQLGPGKAPEAPLDFGRARETGDERDLFAFRTPPLRNVAETGPWMHNGAYTSLEGAVMHHLDVVDSLLNYDASQLDPDLQGMVHDDDATIEMILSSIDRRAVRPVRLRAREFADLMAFLDALTSPSLGDVVDTVPDEVPSGLPVDGID